MKTNVLKFLAIGLALFMVSCGKDKEEDIIKNKYPKEVTIELKVYSPKNEDVYVDITSYTAKGVTITDTEMIGAEDMEESENVKLPFNRKIKRIVNKNHRIILSIQETKGQTYEFIAEILVNGKVVLTQNSTKTALGNVGGIMLMYEFE